MENSIDYINKGGHVDMSVPASGQNPVISTDSYTEEGNRQVKREDLIPAVQMLQRGFIITSQDGGPVDASEVVEGTTSEGLQSELTEVFSKTGGLYYGKKVYVKEQKKFYYYSHGDNNQNMSNDSWKPIG